MVRRTRAIPLLKVLTPVGAAVLLLVVLVWPMLYPTEPAFVLNFQDISAFDDKIRMVKPRYIGRDSKERQYVVTAELATQEKAGAEQVRLENISADVSLANGRWLSLESALGVFTPRKGLLEVSGGVNLFSDRGFELHTESATVDLNKGVARSGGALEGQSAFGTVRAGRFDADLADQVLTFEDGVKVKMYPRAGTQR